MKTVTLPARKQTLKKYLAKYIFSNIIDFMPLLVTIQKQLSGGNL